MDHEITVLATVPPGPAAERLLGALSSTFEVVGRADSLDDALVAAIETVPDVLVVHEDVAPLAAVADFARRLSDSVPITRVVLIASADDEAVYQCVRNGVFTTVETTAPIGEVVVATRGAARRESAVFAGVARALVGEFDGLSNEAPAANRPPSLTMTEREVLTLLAAGHSSEEVATRHDVTSRLVNLHVGYAVAKLQQHLAQQRKLVSH